MKLWWHEQWDRLATLLQSHLEPRCVLRAVSPARHSYISIFSMLAVIKLVLICLSKLEITPSSSSVEIYPYKQ